MNKKQWSNRDYVLSQVKKSGVYIKYADEIFKDDEEIVYAAIKMNGMNVKYASERWRNNPDYMTKAMQLNKMAFVYIGNELQQNSEFISGVCKKYQDTRIAIFAIKCIEKHGLIMPIDGALSLVAVANKNREELAKANLCLNLVNNDLQNEVLKNGETIKINKNESKKIRGLWYSILDLQVKYSQARDMASRLDCNSKYLNKAYNILVNSLQNSTYSAAKPAVQNSEEVRTEQLNNYQVSEE